MEAACCIEECSGAGVVTIVCTNGHYMHADCMERWKKATVMIATCPLCREHFYKSSEDERQPLLKQPVQPALQYALPNNDDLQISVAHKTCVIFTCLLIFACGCAIVVVPFALSLNGTIAKPTDTRCFYVSMTLSNNTLLYTFRLQNGTAIIVQDSNVDDCFNVCYCGKCPLSGHEICVRETSYNLKVARTLTSMIFFICLFVCIVFWGSLAINRCSKCLGTLPG